MTFQKNLVYIIEHIQTILPDKNKLILLTVPDFSTTPAGNEFGDGRDIPKGLIEFNSIWIDIFILSVDVTAICSIDFCRAENN